MKDKDNTIAVIAIVFVCVVILLAVIFIIAEGWLLAAIPLAAVMIPWLGEALKDGADF